MKPLWTPSAERLEAANLTAFSREVGRQHGEQFAEYADLWRWSIDHKWDFWRAMWDYGGVIGTPGERVDATLEILDPGKNAEGFEIDVCLRGVDKKISCANDVAAQAAR